MSPGAPVGRAWLCKNGHLVPFDPRVDHPMCPCLQIPTQLVDVDADGKLCAGDPNDRWARKVVHARYALTAHPKLGDSQYRTDVSEPIPKGAEGLVSGAAWAECPAPGQPIRVCVRWDVGTIGVYRFTEGKGRQPIEVVA